MLECKHWRNWSDYTQGRTRKNIWIFLSLRVFKGGLCVTFSFNCCVWYQLSLRFYLFKSWCQQCKEVMVMCTDRIKYLDSIFKCNTKKIMFLFLIPWSNNTRTTYSSHSERGCFIWLINTLCPFMCFQLQNRLNAL